MTDWGGGDSNQTDPGPAPDTGGGDLFGGHQEFMEALGEYREGEDHDSVFSDIVSILSGLPSSQLGLRSPTTYEQWNYNQQKINELAENAFAEYLERPFVPLSVPIASTIGPGPVAPNLEVMNSFVTQLLGLTRQPGPALTELATRMGVNIQTTALGQAAGISGVLDSEYNVAGPIGVPSLFNPAAAAEAGLPLGYSDSRFGGSELSVGYGGLTFGDIAQLGLDQPAQDEGQQYHLRDYIQPHVPIQDRFGNIYQDYFAQPFGQLSGYHHAYNALTEVLGEHTPALEVATREVGVRATILETQGVSPTEAAIQAYESVARDVLSGQFNPPVDFADPPPTPPGFTTPPHASLPPGTVILQASYTNQPVGVMLHTPESGVFVMTGTSQPKPLADVLNNLANTIRTGGTLGPNQLALVQVMTPEQRLANGIYLRPDGTVLSSAEVLSRAFTNLSAGNSLSANQQAALGAAFINIPDFGDRRDVIDELSLATGIPRGVISAAVGPAMHAAVEIGRTARQQSETQVTQSRRETFREAGINRPDEKIARLEAAGITNNAAGKLLLLARAGVDNPVAAVERLIRQGVDNPVEHLLRQETFRQAGINRPGEKIARLEAAGITNNAEGKLLALARAGVDNPVAEVERLVRQGVADPVRHLLQQATPQNQILNVVGRDRTFTTKAGKAVDAKQVVKNALQNLDAGRPLTENQLTVLREFRQATGSDLGRPQTSDVHD